jgi:ankyrin repeat protein/beta-lactamase regulating signal transducer with metallopeptidase domain
MNYIYDLFSQEVIHALGWTLLHSLWQGALIGIVLAIILLLMRRFTAQTRYYMILTAMLTLLALSIFTFTDLYQTPTAAETAINTQPHHSAAITDNAILLPEEIKQTPAAVSSFTFNQWRQTFIMYFNRHLPSIVTLWLLGMLIFLLKFLGGFAYSQRLKHYRTEPISDNWQEKIKLLCQTLNIDRAVTALKSGMARVPMVIGYFKPVVLVPASLFTGLSPQQIESILAHELAHIARHDYLLNLMQSLIEVIYFYHPAVWWISGCLRSEREHCCDDIAVKVSGDSCTFARTLADLQEKCLESNALIMAFTGSRNKLFQRIHRLVNRPKIKSSFGEGFFAALVIVICLTVVAFSMKKNPQMVAAGAKYSQTDSTIETDQQKVTTPQLLANPSSVAEDKLPQPAELNEFPEENLEVIEEEEALPGENSTAVSGSTDNAARQMRSASKQLREQEQKVEQELLELKKQEKQLRFQNSDQMKIKMRALEKYQEALNTYEQSNIQWDNDDLLEGSSSPGLLESPVLPLPLAIPEVGADWLVAGENKLTTAVRSGNIDSVRLQLSASDVNKPNFTSWTALMEAVKTGNVEIAKLLLEHQANPELRSNQGRTALWIAAYYGHTDVIMLLLNRKAEIDTKDNEGYTPLFAAITKNQFNAVDLLLDKGADINTVSFRGETPLIIAIRQKSSIAHHLILKGADINRPDNSGNMPLLIALKEDLIDIAMRLVEEDADVNARNPEGESPLLYSIKHKHIPLANLLIEKGADVNHKNNYGQTPLLVALDDELYELANKLIEKGADVNITDLRGNTPLLIAIKERLHTLALKIIESKADINKKNVQGDTPLLYALYYDMNEIALLLIEKGAALNVYNREGLSPLAIAVSDGKIELAHRMLEKEAKPDVKNENGKPILLAALDDGLTETVKLLIDKGADINVVDNDGLTPLLMAIDEHYVDICRLLIEKGADVNRKDSQNRSPLGLADENELYEISTLLKSKGAKQ